jgi:hypothetical protein
MSTDGNLKQLRDFINCRSSSKPLRLNCYERSLKFIIHAACRAVCLCYTLLSSITIGQYNNNSSKDERTCKSAHHRFIHTFSADPKIFRAVNDNYQQFSLSKLFIQKFSLSKLSRTQKLEVYKSSALCGCVCQSVCLSVATLVTEH